MDDPTIPELETLSPLQVEQIPLCLLLGGCLLLLYDSQNESVSGLSHEHKNVMLLLLLITAVRAIFVVHSTLAYVGCSISTPTSSSIHLVLMFPCRGRFEDYTNPNCFFTRTLKENVLPYPFLSLTTRLAKSCVILWSSFLPAMERFPSWTPSLPLLFFSLAEPHHHAPTRGPSSQRCSLQHPHFPRLRSSL